ncbi:hypothetical protein ScPMuIL_006990 [Solemya velum]
MHAYLVPWLLVIVGGVHQCYGQTNKAPVFVKDMSEFFISEETPKGTSVYTLSATDEENDRITYSIDADMFRVDRNTGDVYTTRFLDYEDEPILYIKVVAKDSVGNEAIANVQIPVEDANDNYPLFSRAIYTTEIFENLPIGSTVIRDFLVKDLDTQNEVIKVQCNVSASAAQHKESCDTFQLNKHSDSNRDWNGTLTLRKPVDYEKKKLYQYTATASDGVNYFTQSIEIIIKNVQDSPPTFIYAPSPTVDEGKPPNSFISYVEAIDGDLEDKRPVVYELFYDNTCANTELFSVNQTRGNITNIKELDRESPELAEGFIDLCIRAREVIGNGSFGNDESSTATTSIRISVTDINDNNPQFSPSTYTVNIQEDITNRTPLPGLTMTVNDLDTGNAGMYNFKLLDWTHVFTVTPENGRGQTTTGIVVINSSFIDYEVGPRQFILYVEAKEDDTAESLSSTSTVTVNVIDVNDNHPTFVQEEYKARVRETAPGGTEVITIQATDEDSGDKGTVGIRYVLMGNGADKFHIDELSGRVTVANCPTPGSGDCIDFERNNRYELTVVATDLKGESNGLSSFKQLIIDIDDDNDNKPRFIFQGSLYVSYVEELKTEPSPEVILKAIDIDTVGGPVTYSIVSQDIEGLWAIQPTTGKVTATRGVLYLDTPGNQGFFYITVRATDGKYDATINVKIIVIDLNDNSPYFTTIYDLEIPELTPPNTFVVTVKAFDKDSSSSAAGQINYKIEPGNQEKFTIDLVSGNISTSSDAAFDYDVQKLYYLTILATDKGKPQLTGTVTVTVSIMDENNKNPYFLPTIQRTEVHENVGTQYSIYKVSADDKDNDAILKYYFQEPITARTPEGISTDPNIYNFKDLFIIEEGGVVRTNKRLDRDKASVLTYTMIVVDVKPTIHQTGEGTLIINILEYNDQSPYFLPYNNITIDEEQPLGSYIMAMQARDEDDAIEGYEMVSNPQNFFGIAYKTGIVSVNSRIDYEQIQSVSFTVKATDDGSPQHLSATAQVFVTIRNINDNQPQFDSSSYTAYIPENSPGGTPLVTVSASDLDLEDFGVVRYRLEDSSGRFLIDEITGDVTVAAGAILDRETLSTITVSVMVYDTPSNPDPNVRRTNTVPLYIHLGDINDNPPKFTKSEYFASIIETIPENTQVLQVYAKDADHGQNANIYFFKEPNSGDDNDFFSVSQRSGHISTGKSVLGYQGTYRFRVIAQDEGGQGPHKAYAYVTIEVKPATNAPPEWIIPPMENMTIFVLESQYLGMLVYEVLARDRDSGLNGVVDYGFYDLGVFTRNTSEFRINSVTGVIRAEIVYDREKEDRYDLLLVARDRGDPFLETTRFLTIKILDVNDNLPVFPIVNGRTKLFRFNVEEGEAAGKVFGKVEAEDADLDIYAIIYYYIIAGNEESKFAINATTGELRTTTVLDREDKYMYTLDVQATNNVSDHSVITSRRKRAIDPTIATVIITISDTNDMPPVFTQKQYYGCISTRAAFGERILQVKATDLDSPGIVDISFSIVEGNDDGIFSIDEKSGVIVNIKILTADAARTHNLVIEAQDPTNLAVTNVLIFVHEPEEGAKLIIAQPVSESRLFIDQIRKVLEESDDIDYVCVSDIVDHQTGDESLSLWSDIHLSAVKKSGEKTFRILSADELKTIVEKEREENRDSFDLLYIRDIETETENEKFIDGTPVLAVVIIIAVLIFLGLLLIIIAYICIRTSQKHKKRMIETKRLIANQPVVVNPNLNPVYDNRGFELETTKQPEPQQPVYSQVLKTFQQEPSVQVTTSVEASPSSNMEIDMERERKPSPEPEPAMLFAEQADDALEVEIRDSPQSSRKSSPSSSPQPQEEYRIEAEIGAACDFWDWMSVEVS